MPLNFKNVVLKDRENHKHLGVILQNNGKWDTHIKSIIARSCILIACLRSYKHRHSRKSLENMYIPFTLPSFDYADIVWDNCTMKLADESEQLHLDATRTVTGAVRGTSHQSLYKESGFSTLSERRRRHKIILCHKIVKRTLTIP